MASQPHLSGLFLAITLLAPTLTATSVRFTERFAFEPGGIVEIEGSYGELTVEGWDSHDVEVTATRPGLQMQTEGLSAGVDVRAQKVAKGRFLIRTRSLSGRRAEEPMAYSVKIPRNSRLAISHSSGHVLVRSIDGSIRVSNGLGAIDVVVPYENDYEVEAEAVSGEIYSTLPKAIHLPMEDKFRGFRFASAKQLMLRLGSGDIRIWREGENRPEFDPAGAPDYIF